LRDDLPLVYVTMGSSGDPELVPRIVAALSKLFCQVVVAGAGANLEALRAPNVYVADFTPGEAVARRAQLVICNGGSPTCHQALAHGVPVLGIAGNLDQFLNMHYVVASGAGKLLRADSVTQAAIESAARELMNGLSYPDHAARLAVVMRSFDANARLVEVLEEVMR
jgi:UDP:flavonoid glycosyltransferase YjiC (YdhE family)